MHKVTINILFGCPVPSTKKTNQQAKWEVQVSKQLRQLQFCAGRHTASLSQYRCVYLLCFMSLKKNVPRKGLRFKSMIKKAGLEQVIFKKREQKAAKSSPSDQSVL